MKESVIQAVIITLVGLIVLLLNKPLSIHVARSNAESYKYIGINVKFAQAKMFMVRVLVLLFGMALTVFGVVGFFVKYQ